MCYLLGLLVLTELPVIYHLDLDGLVGAAEGGFLGNFALEFHECHALDVMTEWFGVSGTSIHCTSFASR